jgi:ABC-type uncharacterized transport system auxiliary subunit
LFAGCGTIPEKKYFLLNYTPSPMEQRLKSGPYPFVVRLKDFTIEEAYNRPQIVYRQSPFELQYYFYKVWAVKPTRMITDLVNKHLLATNLVGSIVRRFDEGVRPQYELSGMIEAIEEYDSEKIWFAHLALRFQLTRLSDGKVLYNRRFDNRKQVYQNEPENVVKEMSALMEFMCNQAMHDFDAIFSKEMGMNAGPADAVNAPAADSSSQTVPTNEKK